MWKFTWEESLHWVRAGIQAQCRFFLLINLILAITTISNFIINRLILGFQEFASNKNENGFIKINFVRSFCEKHPWRDDRDIWVADKFSVFADGGNNL